MGRTHRTVEQALTPDNATIGKGTIFTSAAAASQRLKMAESLRVDRKSLGHPRRPSPCHPRSEEHTSELQSLMRISYAVFCLKKKNDTNHHLTQTHIRQTPRAL